MFFDFQQPETLDSSQLFRVATSGFDKELSTTYLLYKVFRLMGSDR